MRRKASLTGRTDLAQLLDLTGPMTQAILLVFIVTQATLALANLGEVAHPWVTVIALIIVIGAAVVITRPGAYPLSLPRSLIALASVAASTTMVSSQLPTNGWPGYGSWHLGANTFILLYLALRGRNGCAWIGMVAMTAMTILWTVSTGQGVVAGVNLVDRQAGTLLIGTLFAISLARTGRRIGELNQAESRHAALQATADAASEERGKQVTLLQGQARPVLEMIANQGSITAQQRAEFLLLEATLRDSIRGNSLSQEPLRSSAEKARRRGVEVILLDDSDGQGLQPDMTLPVAAWMAGQLDELHDGRVTARLLPSARTSVASIVVEDRTGTHALEFGERPPTGRDPNRDL